MLQHYALVVGLTTKYGALLDYRSIEIERLESNHLLL